MSIDLNKVVNVVRNTEKDNRKNKKGKIKKGRYRITKAGKIIAASVGNKKGFNFAFKPDGVKPKKPKIN